MVRHQFIVLCVIRGLHLLDEEVDKVEEVDLAPLLLCRVTHVKVDVQIGFLEDKLD